MTTEFGLRLTRRAERHIQQAAEWWELNRPLAPGAVKLEVNEACELLRAQPGVGARAIDTKTSGVRRFYLSRIHHFLYYRVRLPKTLFIPGGQFNSILQAEAERQGIAVVRVPEEQLLVFICEARESFKAHFGGGGVQ